MNMTVLSLLKKSEILPEKVISNEKLKSLSWYKYILKQIYLYGLKNRVRVLPELSRAYIASLFDSSKVYCPNPDEEGNILLSYRSNKGKDLCRYITSSVQRQNKVTILGWEP